jgi:MoaA/NifB/PqqE/SkfB family radical SAM enzyme
MPDFSVPRVTTRAMLDPTRLCHLRCEFCYYLPDDDFHTVKPWEAQRQEVLDAVARGCDSADITGGDPLTNPHVVELVKFCVEKKVYPRIISSLVCKESVLDEVLDAGVADWLISMHGAKDETHNEIVHVNKARSFQVRRLAKIAARMDYCCNYVLVEKNQTEMADWARWLVTREHQPPKVVNFLNYNPHYGAAKKIHDLALANVVDLRIAGPILDEAIDILEEKGVGVNLRYLPMCAIAERHRKSICNDLHVAFDFGEWNNGIGGQSREQGEKYGRNLSRQVELQTEPCASCGLKGICGGANKAWHQLAAEKFGTETLVQIATPAGVDPHNYWHYRSQNVLGLDPRRP